MATLGFEPRPRVPETRIIPLDDVTKIMTCLVHFIIRY